MSLPIITDQRGSVSKEELLNSGKGVDDFCLGCADHGFHCRVSNHVSSSVYPRQLFPSVFPSV